MSNCTNSRQPNRRFCQSQRILDPRRTDPNHPLFRVIWRIKSLRPIISVASIPKRAWPHIGAYKYRGCEIYCGRNASETLQEMTVCYPCMHVKKGPRTKTSCMSHIRLHKTAEEVHEIPLSFGVSRELIKVGHSELLQHVL